MVAREAVNDDRLSFRARGVLAWLLDKPDNWRWSSETLAAAGTEGRDAIRAALRELETVGYLTRDRVQGPDGKWRIVTVIYERPEDALDAQPAPENPSPVPAPEKPDAGKSGVNPLTDTETETEPPNPPAELTLVGAGSSTVAKRDDVEVVFEAWKESTDHPRAVLDPKRRRLILAALGTYSVDDLCAAVRGWRHSAHHRGENDRHTQYNNLELVLRDAHHIEMFRDLERSGGRPAPVAAARMPAGFDAVERAVARRTGGSQ